MQYTVYRNATQVAIVSPTGNQDKRIMGANTVSMQFELPAFTQFNIGDYVDVYGERYYLNSDPTYKEESSIRWSYTLNFQAVPYDLIRAKYFFYGSDNTIKEPDFSLTGTASVFIDLILTNVGRTQSGWIKGTVDDTETVTLTFSNENCMAVLSRLAEQFKTEYWIEGKTIHLTKRGDILPVTLSYGQGKGLRNIERKPLDDNPPITRLYVFGSEKNIPADYRSYSKRLRLPIASAPNGYIEANTALYGIREEVYTNDAIYPNRIGEVTASASINSFTDTGLDFDINAQLIPGTTAKIAFNTGQLAGYSFEISSYNASTHTVTFNTNTDEKALTVPSDLMRPAVGDKWALFDVIMPQSYITAAEQALLVDGQNYLDQNSGGRFNYTLTTDPFHFERTSTTLQLGKYIGLISTEFGINGNIRIVGYSRDIQHPYQYSSVEVSEVTQINPVVVADTKQRDLVNTVSATKKVTGRVGDLAFKSLVEQAMLGETVMDGGYFRTDLIDVLNLIVQNLYTGKVRITAADNNIRIVDLPGDGKDVILLDDNSSYEGKTKSTIPPLTSPGGDPDPNYLYTDVETVGGVDTTYYYYALRGEGMRVGKLGENNISFGKKSIVMTDNNGIIRQFIGSQNGTQNGSVRFDITDGAILDGITYVPDGTTKSIKLVADVVSGVNVLSWTEATPVEEYAYNPVLADTGSGGGTVDPPSGGTTPTTFKAAGFPLGLMTKRTTTDNVNNISILLNDVNRITLENDLKGKSLRPTEFVTNFSNADPQVAWAKSNGLDVHGHCLLWSKDSQQPQYILDYDAAGTLTTDQWKDQLKSYIQTPILHYKNTAEVSGTIKSWDVINEPFLEAPDINTTARIVFKDCVWLRRLGPDYIKLAFQYAYEADPSPLYFLNEYGMEYGWKKVDEMVRLANEYKAAGVPMHGFGLQLHTYVTISDSAITGNLQKLADTGMKIHISEVAMQIRTGSDTDPFLLTPEREATQAAKYVTLFNAFKNIVPTSQKFGITTWGIRDGDYFKVITSGKVDYPMLFDDNFNYKQAYTDALAAILA